MSWDGVPQLSPTLGDVYDSETLDNDDQLSRGNSDSQRPRLPSLYHGTWPMENDAWSSVHCGAKHDGSTIVASSHSVISFASNTSTRDHNSSREKESPSEGKFDVKTNVIYSLLEMLLGDTVGREDTSSTLLSLSTSSDKCNAMRHYGCLPLLVQLIHSPEENSAVRRGASRALYNIVRATQDPEHDDDQELHVLDLVEQLRKYSQLLRLSQDTDEDTRHHPHPISAMSLLMKMSFNENHRHSMCLVGGLHAIAELIEMDHLIHGSETSDPSCLSLRRYSGMTLTNLTFRDTKSKSLLCSVEGFIKAWVMQLRSANEDLNQVTASVLRNLSWRADSNSKRILREAGAVKSLTEAGMQSRRESTLKSVLSALWNLSAHCTTNKADICAVDGALEFLVEMLTFEAPSKTLAVVENAGGILRNVSSHVAVEEDYRSILRKKNCIQILVGLLNSPSLTVVSNACGTLWNLSARCPRDQKTLWELGTVPLMRNLVHSKHKMISVGAASTLRNLLAAKSVLTGYHYPQSGYRPMSSTQSPNRQDRSRIIEGNYRSRSAEINAADDREADRPLSSKSWNSAFPRCQESLGRADDNKRVHKSPEENKKVYCGMRKGSPANSPYFERRCINKNALYEGDNDAAIDYREKYMDDRVAKKEENLKIKSARGNKTCRDRDSNMFSDYAETDLDQPTDYSLRYAEDDTDDEHEDTLKTYCTEGTPYEITSTATSMSDLRLEESKDVDGSKKSIKKFMGLKIKFGKDRNLVEKQPLLTEVAEHAEMEELDSAQEKPEVYYYNEETSGRLSHANSLSSLESESVTQPDNTANMVAKTAASHSPAQSADKAVQEEKGMVESKGSRGEDKCLDRETTKVVTFGGEDYYPDETPLMFSRSSSLGSLSGFEQQSIHDDLSSVISDFSRRTSGVVSPSELPDSPTQTVPPSPRHQKNTDYNARLQEERRLGLLRSPGAKLKRSVFEDDLAAFKEESTPIQFSAATSLSSLTIDDEPRVVAEEAEVCQTANDKSDEVTDAPSTPADSQTSESKESKDHDENLEDVVICEKDEIDVGRFIPSLSTTNLARYQTCATLDQLESMDMSEEKELAVKSKISLDVMPDTVHVYCTEDTPAMITPVGSQSNLSTLSMPSILEDIGEWSEEGKSPREALNSCKLSCEEEKILEECIQAGMPKGISLTSGSNKLDGLSSRPTDIPGASSSSEESVVSDEKLTLKHPAAVQQPEEDCTDKFQENNCFSCDEEVLGQVIHADMASVGLNSHAKQLDGRSHDSTSTLHNSPLNSDEEALLAEVILAGMPSSASQHIQQSSCKRSQGSNSTFHNSPVNSDEEELLPQDINSATTSSILTEASQGLMSALNPEEEALLAEVIHAGMPPGTPKHLAIRAAACKPLDQRSTRTRHNSPLNSDEEALLAEVIHAGMPPGTPKHLAIRAASSKHTQSPTNISPTYPRCDESSGLSSDDDERLLADCTRRGMPKGSVSLMSFPAVPKDDPRRMLSHSVSVSRNLSPRHAQKVVPTPKKSYCSRSEPRSDSSSLSSPRHSASHRQALQRSDDSLKNYSPRHTVQRSDDSSSSSRHHSPRHVPQRAEETKPLSLRQMAQRLEDYWASKRLSPRHVPRMNDSSASRHDSPRRTASRPEDLSTWTRSYSARQTGPREDVAAAASMRCSTRQRDGFSPRRTIQREDFSSLPTVRVSSRQTGDFFDPRSFSPRHVPYKTDVSAASSRNLSPRHVPQRRDFSYRDQTLVYATEDTPCNFSSANSNLSSILAEEDEDKLLAECIKLGMPQSRRK